MAVSSEAEVLGLGTSSRASPKPRLTYWTMLGQGCSALPLQTQRWTQVLQEAPGMKPYGAERLQVHADQPCRAADGTGLWLQLV